MEDLYALAKMPAPTPQPEAATLLDEAPAEIRRPLCLIDGQAYAASWVPYQQPIPEHETSKGKTIPAHTETGKALVLMRSDGAWSGLSRCPA